MFSMLEENSVFTEEAESLFSNIVLDSSATAYLEFLEESFQLYSGGRFLLAGEEEDLFLLLPILAEMLKGRVVFVERVKRLKAEKPGLWASLCVSQDDYTPKKEETSMMRDLIEKAAKMRPDAIIAVDALESSVIDHLIKFLNYGYKGGAALISRTLEETIAKMRRLQAESKTEISDTLPLLIQLERVDGELRVRIRDGDYLIDEGSALKTSRQP